MPALKALAAQLAAVLATAALLIAVRAAGLPAPGLLAAACVQGVLAAGASALLRADRWWLPLQLLFLPAVVLALRLQLPDWLYLAGFLALVLVYWSSFRTQVPLYLSNRATVTALAQWLPAQPLAVLDAGSGTGGFARALARLCPGCRITGIELAPLPWALSRLAARGQDRLQMLRADLWQHDLSRYDLVYAFLSPVPMPALWDKARREMRRGGWLVSNSFPVPGVEPAQVLEVGDRRGTRLYCYRL